MKAKRTLTEKLIIAANWYAQASKTFGRQNTDTVGYKRIERNYFRYRKLFERLSRQALKEM